MNSDRDCTFRPRLESLEDRFLLTGTTFRSFLPQNFIVIGRTFGGTHTAAQVHTLVNPAGAVSHSVTIVPQHISLGLFDSPSPVHVSGFDTGISNSGLRTPSVLASDAGFIVPGLPSFAPSQPVTPPPQSTGLTLSPEGVVSGSLF